jgi:drug/metabolite transporter (DMT)-like permease
VLGIAAAVVFAVAFVINVAGISVDAVFLPMSLLLLGLALLALHLSGIGSETSLPSRRRRR